MKRAEALTSLSHDHHQALALALRLRRSGPETAAADRGELLRFWENQERHFELEEEILLPALEKHAGAGQPLADRTRTEHQEIRRRIGSIADEDVADAATLVEFGELLNSHVRMEERELFPLVERSLPSEELALLAQKLDDAHPGEGDRVRFRE